MERESEASERSESKESTIAYTVWSSTVICGLNEIFIYTFSDGVLSRAESRREG